MKILSRTDRIYNFLRRQLKAPWASFSSVQDPHYRRGRRWALQLVLQAVLGGPLTGFETLREVEGHSPQLLLPGCRLLPRRLPDTTVYDLMGELSPEPLRQSLVQQVRTLWRQKSLAPVGLPCGVVAIDGKAVRALDHRAAGWGRKNHREHNGMPYWLVRVLRAVLTSSVGKADMEQVPIPAHTNEMGTFPAMFQ